MTRGSLRRGVGLAVGLFVAMLVVGSVLSGGVVATPQGGNSTTTAAGNATAEQPTEIVGYVDDDLRVLDYYYNESLKTMVVTLENTGSDESDVTMTEAIEAGDDSGGSSTFGIKNFGVESGETVTVSLKLRTDASTPGVMVTTAESVSQGKGRVLWAEEREQGLIRGEATWSDVRAGAGIGVGMTLFVVLLAAWQIVASRNNDYEEKSL